MIRLCEVCSGAAVLAGGRCRSDYRFWRRFGRDRTPAEIRALQARRRALADARYRRRMEREELRALVKVAESHACNS